MEGKGEGRTWELLGFPQLPRRRVRSLLPGELFTNVVKFDVKGAPKLDSIMTDSVQGIVDQMSGTNATSSIDALLERPRALLGDSLPRKNETPPPEPAR